MSLVLCSLKLKNASARIMRIKDFVDANPPDSSATNPGKYKIRLEALNTSYKEFLKNHDDVTLLNVTNEADEPTVEAHSTLHVDMETLVYDLKESLESVLISSNPALIDCHR